MTARTRYGFSVNVKGVFCPVHPTGGKPYRYDTRAEAEHMAEMCYGPRCVKGYIMWRVDEVTE